MQYQLRIVPKSMKIVAHEMLQESWEPTSISAGQAVEEQVEVDAMQAIQIRETLMSPSSR